jgi:hypothetical protein
MKFITTTKYIMLKFIQGLITFIETRLIVITDGFLIYDLVSYKTSTKGEPNYS